MMPVDRRIAVVRPGTCSASCAAYATGSRRFGVVEAERVGEHAGGLVAVRAGCIAAIRRTASEVGETRDESLIRDTGCRQHL